MAAKKDSAKKTAPAKKAASKSRARKRTLKEPSDAPKLPQAPEGTTLTWTPEVTSIEDLRFEPPLRAHATTPELAIEAYEHQKELRSRAGGEDRGPVIATGVKSALPPDEPTNNSDLTPGRSNDDNL